MRCGRVHHGGYIGGCTRVGCAQTLARQARLKLSVCTKQKKIETGVSYRNMNTNRKNMWENVELDPRGGLSSCVCGYSGRARPGASSKFDRSTE